MDARVLVRGKNAAYGWEADGRIFRYEVSSTQIGTLTPEMIFAWMSALWFMLKTPYLAWKEWGEIHK